MAFAGSILSNGTPSSFRSGSESPAAYASQSVMRGSSVALAVVLVGGDDGMGRDGSGPAAALSAAILAGSAARKRRTPFPSY